MKHGFYFVVVGLFSQMLSAQTNEFQDVLIRYKNRPTAQVFRNAQSFQKFLADSARKTQTEIFRDLQISESNHHLQNLWLVSGTMAKLNPQEISQLRQDERVASITKLGRKSQVIEEKIKTLGYGSPYTYGLEKLKIPELNAKYPEINGNGITVGIIDTGIDQNHPDLRGKMIQFKDFTSTNQTPRDDHGHGTHVAGTVAGGNTSGEAIGVAPGVQLIIAKGFKGDGSSEDSKLLQALQWMADPDGNPETHDAPQIISNSWNVDGNDFRNRDPNEEVFCQAIDTLAQLGIISVFAAGNDGPDANTILVPGACPAAVTVGATDEYDRAADFSSRGPVQWKTLNLNKPDIAAPGQYIESAAPGGDYQTKSGTSMATPHIAGALALILSARPLMTADEAKQYLIRGAQDLGSAGPDLIFGAGRADVLKSVDLVKSVP